MKKVCIIILNVVMYFAIFTISFFCFNYPQITLNGSKNIKLKVNEEYIEKGAKANFFTTNISDNIKIKNNINTKKIGNYRIKYVIEKYGIKKSINRNINVIDDIPPVIELTGGNEVTVCPNKEYEEIGYKGTDNYDGDITDKISVITSYDIIKYKLNDSSNNTTISERKIIYGDIEIPTINLVGNTTMNIRIGSTYTEPGYTAYDNCDGDITSKVEITGKVDTNKMGTYELKYSITDSNNNKSEVIRKVVVYQQRVTTYNGTPDGKIYLTFDDGPSASITPTLLNILKEENVKATFFVINKNNGLNYLIKRAYDEGHTVAIHSSTHRYDIIYSSVDAYFNDLITIQNKVKSITGEESKIIRFPGGSSNTVSKKYTLGIMSMLALEVEKRGFKYFDWNIGSGDAGGAKTSSDVYNNVTRGLSKSKTNIVLMHDFENNYKTLNAIRDIISYGKSNGYSFEKITMDTPSVKHSVSN